MKKQTQSKAISKIPPALPSERIIQEFRTIVYGHYASQGRRLPWRTTEDPYRILVSEVMLQQTQVARVVGKYKKFIRRFPDVATLARAGLREVLSVWQGLGYNRRALALKKMSEKVMEDFGGTIPRDAASLATLPGIGKATANAVCAFAYNHPAVYIETNIRTVFIHHFFSERTDVKDSEIMPFVARALDRTNPRRWYNALMDYGVFLKKHHTNPGRTSAHYYTQSPFEGSDRQVRGAILKMLVQETSCTEEELAARLPFSATIIARNIRELEKEGLLTTTENKITIA